MKIPETERLIRCTLKGVTDAQSGIETLLLPKKLKYIRLSEERGLRSNLSILNGLEFFLTNMLSGRVGAKEDRVARTEEDMMRFAEMKNSLKKMKKFITDRKEKE